jgi:hypothetical protein
MAASFNQVGEQVHRRQEIVGVFITCVFHCAASPKLERMGGLEWASSGWVDARTLPVTCSPL